MNRRDFLKGTAAGAVVATVGLGATRAWPVTADVGYLEGQATLSGLYEAEVGPLSIGDVLRIQWGDVDTLMRVTKLEHRANSDYVTVHFSQDKPARPDPLPKQCAEHLKADRDVELWDESAHSYPRNLEWERCMGVGPRPAAKLNDQDYTRFQAPWPKPIKPTALFVNKLVV